MTPQVVRAPLRSVRILVAATTLVLCSTAAFAKDVKVSLTGAEETPPVTTSAEGHGTIKIAKDNSVSGTIKTTTTSSFKDHLIMALFVRCINPAHCGSYRPFLDELAHVRVG